MKNLLEFDQMIVKGVASLAKKVAQESVDARCWLFVYQSNEPEDMAKRLQEMS